MVYLRSSIIFLIACQLINLGFSPTMVSAEASAREKAFFLSENNCEKFADDTTGAPILYEGSDVILLGKTKEMVKTYGPNNAQYSMKVIPQCLMRGDTSENEVVVRNLGKTKCGASNVEINGNYLFFLRRTSDPKVYEALNVGAKRVSGATLWTDLFTLFCGIKKVTKCKAGACPAACNYMIPDINSCIQMKPTITDLFKSLYPDGFPTTTTTTTTSAPSTTTETEKDMKKKSTMAADIDLVTYSEGNQAKVEQLLDRKTGQAGLSSNVLLIFSTVFIVLLFSL